MFWMFGSITFLLIQDFQPSRMPGMCAANYPHAPVKKTQTSRMRKPAVGIIPRAAVVPADDGRGRRLIPIICSDAGPARRISPAGLSSRSPS